VTAANEQHYDTDLLEVMATRVVIGDGAMGSQLVSLGKYDIADKIRELALEGTANAKRIGSSWASRRRVTT
jgi:methionine synthase I (cobalamin-dependent)